MLHLVCLVPCNTLFDVVFHMPVFMGLFVEVGPYSVENKLFLGNRKKPLQVRLQKAMTSTLNEYGSDHNNNYKLL